MFPAGWYPDPHTPNQVRYWDGTQWTGATALSAEQGYRKKNAKPGTGLATANLIAPFVVGTLLAVGYTFFSIMLGEAPHYRDDIGITVTYQAITWLWLLTPVTQTIVGIFGILKHKQYRLALTLNIISTLIGIVGALLLGSFVVPLSLGMV
jgi:hypothetical protein